MCRRPTWCLLLLASCGAHISGTAPDQGGSDDTGGTDAGLADAAIGDAQSLGPWSAPAPVLVAATTTDQEDDVTLSSSALEMIFAVVKTGGKDLYYTSRTAIGAAWSKPEIVPFDTANSEETPRFSGDDKLLYFSSDRSDPGDLDIWSVTRKTIGSNATWDEPAPVTKVKTAANEKWLAPCAGGRFVVVRNRNNNGNDLLEGTLDSDTLTPLGALNTANDETGAFLTQDCLTIYFTSDRVKPRRIFTSHRTAIAQPWSEPSQVDDFKLPAGVQEDPWLSPDGRTFALASDALGTSDVYLSTR
jgi:Tol biopolymer transport system component